MVFCQISKFIHPISIIISKRFDIQQKGNEISALSYTFH